MENINVGNNWSCPQCTLLNNVQEERCKACDYELPTNHNVPHFSINSAMEKIDSALDMVANTLTPRNGQNVQLYPQLSPIQSSSTGSIAICNSNWTCKKCSQFNTNSWHCARCNSERDKGIISTYWTCSNMRCGLKQPNPPINSRCPLCRNKCAYQRIQSSKSMPRLDLVVSDATTSSSFGQFDGNENIGNSNTYNEIIQYCSRNRQNFIDDSFPHSSRSIGDLAQLEKNNLNIIWLRPDKIVTRDGRITRWSVFNDPQPTDIEQGFLGNCWFLSAMAVVSERPDILEKLFLTKQYNHAGVYEMRLCIDGIWQNVLVDDYFPCHRSNRTMVFGLGRKNQLWVPLLEKALAKIYGNYAILRAGRTVEGLSTLTGAPTQSIDLECTELDGAFNQEHRQAMMDIIWAQLLSAREARFIMGCSCGAGKRQIDENEYRRVGLMSQHAYSILDVRQTMAGYRVLQIKNPWGTFVWLGEFSQGWIGWTPQLLAELNSEANTQPGTFWMPYERFTHYFDTVDIAQIHNRWSIVRYAFDIGWEASNAQIVRFTITEPTELCVILHQRNARTALDQVDIMVLIHRQDPLKEAHPGELICRSPRKIQPSVRTEDKFFLPGEYLVYAHSFSKFNDKMVPVSVVIHSSKRSFSELIQTPIETFKDSVISLLLKEGTVQEAYGGSCIRYLTNEFAGLALMVINTCKDYCIQVSSDCQDSTNLLSTRASLLTVDSIPPLHRQIVTILTHFEPSQAFVVSHKLYQRPTSFPQLRDLAPSTEFANTQNFPSLIGTAVGTLHGPSSLFT